MWLHGYSQFTTEGFEKAQRLHSFWVPSSRRTAIYCDAKVRCIIFTHHKSIEFRPSFTPILIYALPHHQNLSRVQQK